MRHERGLVKSLLTSRGFVECFNLSENDLAAITTSILMIYGSDDPVGSTDIWEEFTRTMPQATPQVAPDSGHLPWYDNPQQVAARILDHLTD